MESSEHARVLAATLLSPRDRESLHRRPVGLSLEVIQGPDQGRQFELPQRTKITGGRAPSHDVALIDDSVSTTHFEIRLTPQGVYLRDLGSTNGTWLGRTRLIDGTVNLFDGAVFYAGDTKLRLTQIDVDRIARSERPALGTMTGASPAIREIFAMLDRLGPTPLTTLITGETGTGKEEVARTLHELSGRKGPFIVLDCGALPLNLAESAILGHVKGAFTGANADRMGAFEAAEGGDRVARRDRRASARVAAQTVASVGSSRSRARGQQQAPSRRRSRARGNPPQPVSPGGRGALPARPAAPLATVRGLSPTAARAPQDVPVLVRHFLERIRAQHGGRVASGIDDEAIVVLSRRYWEGNVRELRQCVEALAHLSKNATISVSDVQGVVGGGSVYDTADVSHVASLLPLQCKDAVDGFICHYLAKLEELHRGDVEAIRVAAGYTRKGLRGLYDRLGRPWPAARDDST